MAPSGFRPVSPEQTCCGVSARKAYIGLGVGLAVTVITVAVAGLLWHRWASQTLPSPQSWNGRGSTPNFAQIVLGRCYSYTQILKPELGARDCGKIVEAFRKAFLAKNPCHVTEQDYEPLIKLVNQTVPCDKTLFWSKTKELVHRYTGVQTDFLTLEDTLLGHLADGLNWCGDASSSEMNYQSCPLWKRDCHASAVSVFWNVASRRFAEDACGKVHVMLNGSISNPFDKNSTFGRLEIFNLQPAKVHTLQAWLVHDIGGVSSDSCSSSSINDLRSIINKRNITFLCQDNYRPVKFLQCVKSSEHSACRSKI